MRSVLFRSAALGLLVTAPCALAFPEGASVPSAAELTNRLTGKVFSVKLANGTSWRLEFKGSGYFYVNTSAGFSGSGKWQAEDGRLCSNLQGNPTACNDARVHGDLLHVRRTDGEIIQYVPK